MFIFRRLFESHLRLATHEEMARRGIHRDRIHEYMKKWNDHLPDNAIGQVAGAREEIDKLREMAPGENAGVEALGDGTFIQKVIAFFKSPIGQAIISVIITLLTTA